MMHFLFITFRSIFRLMLLLSSASMVLAEQNVSTPVADAEKLASYYLQKGHQANNNGDIEKAITLYKKSLNASPEYRPAKYSLESAQRKLEIHNWKIKNLPERCQLTSKNSTSKDSMNCTDQYFSLYGEPIHPKIIKSLNTWLSDSGDQIVSINLYDSQQSNLFCCDKDIQIEKSKDKKTIFFSENGEEFGYRHIGKTASGVHILSTYYSGGGSGVFKNIMLVVIESDYGTTFDEENSIIKETRPRLLLKKMGEVVLGDRWSGNLAIDGNNLIIGKDSGIFSGTKNGGRFSKIPRDRIIKIDVAR